MIKVVIPTYLFAYIQPLIQLKKMFYITLAIKESITVSFDKYMSNL
jgi:hypothetical protein